MIQYLLQCTNTIYILTFNTRVLQKLSMYQIGRNFYSPSDPVEVPQHNLTLWPGFAVSVGHFENKVMLCADVSHKVLRSENVLEFMTNLYNNSERTRFPENCEKELPTDTFQKRDGTQISYEDYYKQQYDVVMTDLSQPMLVSQLKSRGNRSAEPRVVHLIPELCYMTGLSTHATSDFRLMRDLAQHTHLAPQQRHQRLSRLADNIQRNKDARFELENWGLQMGCQASLTGRVISPEKILMQNETCSPVNPGDWFRDLRNMKTISETHLERWLVLCSYNHTDLTHNFLNCLRRVGSPMNFHIQYPRIMPIKEGPMSFVKVLQQHVNPELQLVLCVLSSNKKDCYDSVKKFLSLHQPIPSQCVLVRTLSKQGMMMSVATKIAMQIICKLGGELWAVEIPLKSLMVVGIDVNKDTLTKGNSVVGFVASLNASITKWHSRCIFQCAGTSMADCLRICMEGAINNWEKCNGHPPARIIIYRDGVGDGQLKMVMDYEVPQLLSVLDECSGECRPKMTLIIVKKKCLSRFFVESNGGLRNPPVGTKPPNLAGKYDFFLISQLARQGTVNPTYYNVVYDDNKLSPDHMQRFTFKMCHLYYNWPGLIRVPAPCQYANKLTFLVSQSIHQEPSLELANKLFYL
ncbi:Piwi-like protein 4, partial [Ophiophagus hannah]